jgi:hypothetical protein
MQEEAEEGNFPFFGAARVKGRKLSHIHPSFDNHSGDEPTWDI